jgi:N,N'-diacetyllegionaminate synthase
MRFKLGHREIGEGTPCYVVFEAGPTHSGLESARGLVKLAAEAGADAVKFQIFDPDRLVADKKQTFSYDVLVDRASGRTETVTESLYDILCRRCLTRAEWTQIKKYCDELNLAFFSTVGFEDDLEFLLSIGCHSIKIASSDITHLPLIKAVAHAGLAVQIDTGGATLSEVEQAADAIFAAGNRKLIIHHCPTGYPARLESINLRIIPTLISLFNCPIAYSDHSPGWDMDMAAIALGAGMVEKTITYDRTTRSVEHMFSLEPADMARFVTAVRELETALGATRKAMTPEQALNRFRYRRSAHVLKQVKPGDILSEQLIEFRRPGNGIPPDQYHQYIGMRFRRALAPGEIVMPTDLDPAAST